MPKKLVTINGQTKGIGEWCRQNGINHTTYCVRMRRGWSQEDALTVPTHRRKINVPRCTEHTIWNHMWKRCVDPRNEAYARYGGRGIKVCDRWRDFFTFVEDMGKRPSKRHSLDRIDNDGNYEPSNCRWASHNQQINNRRSTVWITSSDGQTKTLTQWAAELGVSRETIKRRLEETPDDQAGALERATVNREEERKVKITVDGETRSLQGWSKKNGIPSKIIWQRINRDGWSYEKAVTEKPVKSRKGTRNQV